MTSDPEPRRWRAREVMIASVWFGVLTGLIEVTLLAIKKFALGQVVRVSGDVVWMSPVANLCWFLLVAAVLAAAVRATPPAHRFRVMFTVLVAVSAFAIVLHYSRLALVAKALIAGGIGVQSARMMARRELRFAKLVRQTLPSLAGLVLVLVAALYGWEWFGYQRAIARLPPNAERAPNVLLIVLDTVRAANVGLYGYRRERLPISIAGEDGGEVRSGDRAVAVDVSRRTPACSPGAGRTSCRPTGTRR